MNHSSDHKSNHLAAALAGTGVHPGRTLHSNLTAPALVAESLRRREGRLSIMIDQQHVISGEQNDRWVGREAEVLIEGFSYRDEAQLYGKTREFKTLVLPNDGTPAGTLKRVRITGATTMTLFAEALDAQHPDVMVQIAG